MHSQELYMLQCSSYYVRFVLKLEYTNFHKIIYIVTVLLEYMVLISYGIEYNIKYGDLSIRVH